MDSESSQKIDAFLSHGDGNDWREYRKLVLFQLRSLTEEVESLRKELQEARSDITIIKAKAGVIAAIAGGAVTALFQVFEHFAK